LLLPPLLLPLLLLLVLLLSLPPLAFLKCSAARTKLRAWFERSEPRNDPACERAGECRASRTKSRAAYP
jgi:hypothetical protein